MKRRSKQAEQLVHNLVLDRKEIALTFSRLASVKFRKHE